MIKRITLKHQAYEYLYHAVLKGEILGSQVYSEQYFADLLGISRTPVREAVMQLAQEGFLQVYPNKGFSVKKVKAEEVEELFGYRAALESYCACMAARSATSARSKTLVQKLKKYNQAQKDSYEAGEPVEQWMAHDFAFHQAIIDYLHNRQITDSMERLRARINLLGIRSLYMEGRTLRVLEEHQAIIDAISMGRVEDVVEGFARHFDRCKYILAEEH